VEDSKFMTTKELSEKYDLSKTHILKILYKNNCKPFKCESKIIGKIKELAPTNTKQEIANILNVSYRYVLKCCNKHNILTVGRVKKNISKIRTQFGSDEIDYRCDMFWNYGLKATASKLNLSAFAMCRFIKKYFKNWCLDNNKFYVENSKLSCAEIEKRCETILNLGLKGASVELKMDYNAISKFKLKHLKNYLEFKNKIVDNE
jgi:hypothetical protein